VHWSYGAFEDGEAFLSPDDLFANPKLVEFILAYGEQALDALPEADDQIQQLIEQMIQAGLLERDEAGKLKLAPRMVKGMQHRAMLEVFSQLKPGVRDGHSSRWNGLAGERGDGSRPYQFGDPLTDIDHVATLSAALKRRSLDLAKGASTTSPGLLPLRLDYDDIVLHNIEAQTDSAIVVLIDLSGSMARYGRHIAAKKVALGLQALVRRRFPLDSLDFVAFSSVAEVVREDQLPLIMPKPITTSDWQIRVRIPLDQADQTHPHFTNLHHGLRVARQILSRKAAANKQVFIITDGQPTAHLTAAKDTGTDILNLIYPPSPASVDATLAEALKLHQQGIRFATFALIEEYHAMEWVGFVEQLTRLVRGVAYYCAAGDLAATIMESYLSGKRTRQTLG
jgi:Ca-activated chloride channel homolog